MYCTVEWLDTLDSTKGLSTSVININASVQYIAARLIRGRWRAAVVREHGVGGRSPGVLVGDLEWTERCRPLVVERTVSPTHVPPAISYILACGDKIECGNVISECMVRLYALKLTEDPHPAVPYRFRSQQ